jgi:putative ABC transport system permease protein
VSIRQRAARLLALLFKNRLERELDNEVLAHLELAAQEGIARGLDPDEAWREARRRFGGIEQMKERHRDDRSARWIENLVKDLRYGVAGLRRQPVFAIVAVGVLALAIGANTAMFSVVDAILLRSLPFPEPDRIVRWWEAPTTTTSNSTTALNFGEIKRISRSFEALSAEAAVSETVSINGEPTRLARRLVSADHFDVFRIHPLLGRSFRPDEDREGAPKVVVLSHAAWQRRFGGDPQILDRTILLDNVPHQVIGVLPPGAFDRDKARPRDEAASFWKPQAFTEQQIAAGSHWLNPVGRLKPGVSLAEAQQDLLAARAQIDPLIPAWKKNWSVVVEPYDARLIDGQLRQSLYVALGAVLLVLLIACANMTNLLLARGVARQRELALRAALGAGRARLAAQMLTETLVLGACGGFAGVALAYGLIQAAIPLLPLAVPYTADVTLNSRVLIFAAAVVLGVSAAVGLLPALRLSGASYSAALNSGARGSSSPHDRIRRLIISAEVAVSLMLVCGSLLLFKSLMRLQQVDIGASAANVVTASIDIARASYPTPERATAFYDALLERVRAIPGIERVSLSGDVPLEGTGGENLRIPGRDSERLLVRFKRAGEGYFETLGIPVVAGRTFTAEDRRDREYVTVINEALAAQLEQTFGLSDPIGKVVDLPALRYGTPTTRERMTIVGVVRNERVRSDLRSPVEGIAYVPLAQAPLLWLKLAARVHDPSFTVVPAIREALRDVDPRVALADVLTLDQIRSRSFSGLQEPAWLIGSFAVLSALLAALGLYGVVSQSVTQQRREIGVRLALGATGMNVLGLILRNVLTMVSAGVVVGLVGSAAASQLTESLLFEVSPFDPFAFAAAASILALVGAVAAVIPASRATRVDPTVALRADV